MMIPVLPTWASELAWLADGDEVLPSVMEGANVVLNRARLSAFIAGFAEDKDVRDLLVLDVVAAAAELPFSSTGLAELGPSLALRPFRIWEYTWLYKNLGLSLGGAKVLDLGGPASHLSIMAALAGCHVTSVDLNPEFVRAAQECARELDLAFLDTRVGDMCHLSQFPDESFDRVVSCSVLEHLTAQDQELALREMARVLKPGGVVGITFDYGIAAPGANVYLPPPHDPPPTAAEALRRYLQGGLVVAGNPFLEDPVPGVLFNDQDVRYTVASLFLAKPPVPDIPLPACERAGTVLNALVVQRLPSRINKSVVRARDHEHHTAARLVELERIAQERLTALQRADEELKAISREAEKRERGLHDLTSIITERDARIATHEARIAAQDGRVFELEQTLQERLSECRTREDALVRQVAGFENQSLLEFMSRQFHRSRRS
jgi:SAM-dependent methyltransferase